MRSLKDELIEVEVSMEAAPSVLWDGVVVVDGADAAETLAASGQAVEFIQNQYRHCKPILVLGAASMLADKAGLPAELPNGGPDPGVLRYDSDEAEAAIFAFTAALAKHRHFERETDPPRV